MGRTGGHKMEKGWWPPLPCLGDILKEKKGMDWSPFPTKPFI